MKIALIFAVIAAIAAMVAYVLQRLANEALIHMMLEKGIHVNEQEFKRHLLESLRSRFRKTEK